MAAAMRLIRAIDRLLLDNLFPERGRYRNGSVWMALMDRLDRAIGRPSQERSQDLPNWVARSDPDGRERL